MLFKIYIRILNLRDKMEEYINLFEKIIEKTIPQVDYRKSG